ncbi:vancomycin B-type resistance protein VanW [Oxobacter pfennigii]|uniref:Vancomycin B-type resistance protein VanW n=1 Tax=Oxobacter pfennigii TaxID=36849 RepID=A0A0P8WSY4_9CLOT|nr:VanW family protein [Oxobacter pfennigii]KPU45731.1 vancomycin B-type resistance protein VanW [Oxobacter pfennigii]
MKYKSGILYFTAVTISAVLLVVLYSAYRFTPRRGSPDNNIQITPEQNISTPDDILKEPALPAPTIPIPEVTPSPIVTVTPAPPLKITPTPTPRQQIKKNVVPKNAIGAYETSLMDKSSKRSKNISLASKQINGYVVNPGETFSFNQVVGERTKERGFLSAKIIVNGKYDEGTGGGVCQLSSTLFNAVKKSNLEIVERHPHSKKVAYVGEGRDAAVNYGSLDFKFKNNKDYPVQIKAGVKNGKVYTYILKVK